MAPDETSDRAGRLFAIGDIHGCADELAAMLQAIAPGAGDTVVFVGDYVDRGPSPKAVIERLLELKRAPCTSVFLKGNHEDMMLAFLGYPGRHGDSFLFNGGFETLESYGIRKPSREAALEAIPFEHLNFLRELQTRHEQGPFLFVHAGVRPDRPLEAQDEEDLLWIRHEFILEPHRLGRTVVFGHTPMRNVLYDPPYKLGIDTGLVYGGKLTCVELNEGVVHQIARGSTRIKTFPLASSS